MNTSISKNSWHYKLACKDPDFCRWYAYNRGETPIPIDTCTYAGYVMRELAKIVAISTLILFLVASVATVLGAIVGKYSSYTLILELSKSNIFVSGMTFAGLATLIFAGILAAAFIIGSVVESLSSLVKDVNYRFAKSKENVVKVEKPAGFFTVAKMKFKEKTCTRVTFVE